MKGYVVSLEEDRTRAEELARLLQSHRIRVHGLARDVEVGGERFRAGSAYLVPVDQPQARFVAAVMERAHEFQDSLFYDVSTWTLPLAYGVRHAELTSAPGGALGPELPPMLPSGGELVGGRASYAYLMPWDRYYAPRALYHLQEAGVRARLMSGPFSAVVDGEAMELPRGTVVIPVVQGDVRADEVHALVAEAVERDHVRVFATGTGLTPAGFDLGSRSAEVLERPRIALLTGSGASAYRVGEAWHLLTERFSIPVSLLDVDAVSGADLDRYNTIVLAGGWYGSLDAERLQGWVRSGGRLIGLGDAVEWLVRHELLGLEPREVDFEGMFEDTPYADLPDARGAQVIGGAILGARLDTTHPLAFGYDEVVPLFRQGEHAFEADVSPGTLVGRYLDEPVLSGYVSGPRRAQLAGSAAIVAERHGAGSVMGFLDDLNFRGHWYGTNGLFLNAIFFGGAF